MNDHSKRSASKRTSSAKLQHKSSKPSSSSGQVRIIAGQWRGRKLPVLDANGLRPTGDRIRETLFNWIQMSVSGRHCLDLFAGTGALGLEAASRGAASVSLVERNDEVASQLQQNLVMLECDESVSLHNMAADEFLSLSQQQYDLVFIDPPFSQDLHDAVLAELVPKHLASDALIYLELPTSQSEITDRLPESLSIYKHKRFGDVTVFVLEFTG